MSAKIVRLETVTTPSHKGYQGQFLKTVKRKNKSGTRFEFWFKPDSKLRTEAWERRYRPSIRLPRDTSLRTGLDPKLDPTEHAAAWKEAAALWQEFNELRDAPADGGAWPHGTLRWLCDAWERSDWFEHDLRPNTKRLYQQQLKDLRAWADRIAEEKNKGIHPHVSRLTHKGVSVLLHEYDDRPTKRSHMRRVLKNLMSYAIELGLRTDNPVDGVVLRRTRAAAKKQKTVIWTQQFVDHCVEWATANDRPEVAAMILLMWDCGRRPNDIFRLTAMNDMERQMLVNGALNSDDRPMLYDAHRRAIMGWVAKTGNYIEIPLDEPTVDAIALVCPEPTENRRHLFVQPKTGEPYRTDTWKYPWGNMRDHVASIEGMEIFKDTTWQKGRASAIVRNKRAGLDDAAIIALSDHSDPETVYQHYWTPDDAQAAAAKKQRRDAENRNAK